MALVQTAITTTHNTATVDTTQLFRRFQLETVHSYTRIITLLTRLVIMHNATISSFPITTYSTLALSPYCSKRHQNS